jgi:hypothetical protein
MTFTEQQHRPGPLGSLDGDGAGDNDPPYSFGYRPRASVPNPPAPRSEAERGFNTRQYARLLVLRNRLQDRVAGEVEADGTPRSAALHGAGSSLATAA